MGCRSSRTLVGVGKCIESGGRIVPVADCQPSSGCDHEHLVAVLRPHDLRGDETRKPLAIPPAFGKPLNDPISRFFPDGKTTHDRYHWFPGSTGDHDAAAA